ncbi:hypothetical protein D3C72_1401350 [compost metagenome]
MRVGSGSMASRTLAIRWVRPCTVAASRSWSSGVTTKTLSPSALRQKAATRHAALSPRTGQTAMRKPAMPSLPLWGPNRGWVPTINMPSGRPSSMTCAGFTFTDPTSRIRAPGATWGAMAATVSDSTPTGTASTTTGQAAAASSVVSRASPSPSLAAGSWARMSNQGDRCFAVSRPKAPKPISPRMGLGLVTPPASPGTAPAGREPDRSVRRPSSPPGRARWWPPASPWSRSRRRGSSRSGWPAGRG